MKFENSKLQKDYNYIILGAGIVGVSTAMNLLDNDPNYKILIIEKEDDIGKHQTGNNSGVIHSGIYYKPNSLKAKNCREGYKLLLDFCNKYKVEYDICGKLIIATNKDEENQLDSILMRGNENGLSGLKIIDKSEIEKLEPYVKSNKAIHVPETGIIDYSKVINKFANIIKNRNVEILLNTEVLNIIEENSSVSVITKNNSFTGKYAISCVGLQSDRIAKKNNNNLDFQIIPFRGEYYKLKDKTKYLVNNLIYPVPNPSFPFLGVHFTRRINGEIEAGPNAVLSFAREGYRKTSFNFKDTVETFTWPGFRILVNKYWKTGIGEFYRSISKEAFTIALQKLIPSIESSDLEKGGVGIRAQACDINGLLVDDFVFSKSNRVLHVCNAPSPAATASIAIGKKISEMIVS